MREQDARLFAGFWTARWGREKDMTPLRDVLFGDYGAKEPERPQTPDEMQRALDMLVIATGGTLGPGKRRRRRKKASSGVPEHAANDDKNRDDQQPA